MKKVLTFIVAVVISLATFGQSVGLRSSQITVPDMAHDFPITIPAGTEVYVQSTYMTYSVLTSFTNTDNMNDVIASGSYRILTNMPDDTNYFDFAGTTITTKSGVDSVSFKGDDVTMNGKIYLPNTTFASQNGIIYKNGVHFIHNFNYGNNGTVTTEGFNTFWGTSSGNLTMGATATSTLMASYNTGIGHATLNANTTGSHNIATGHASLYNNTTGLGNTANGYTVLFNNTTGNYNSGYGFNSLGGGANKSNSYNVAQGYYSGFYESGSYHIYLDNRNRGSLASGREQAPFHSVTDATPSLQITQIGGGGKVYYTGYTEQYQGTQGKRIEKTVNRDVTHSDASWYELYVDGVSDTLLIPLSSTWTFSILITGGNDDQTKSFGYEIKGVADRAADGTTTLNGSTVTTIDEDDADFNARVTVSAGKLKIETTDATSGGDVIRWFATIVIAQQTF